MTMTTMMPDQTLAVILLPKQQEAATALLSQIPRP
jgi:hypothetical protein